MSERCATCGHEHLFGACKWVVTTFPVGAECGCQIHVLTPAPPVPERAERNYDSEHDWREIAVLRAALDKKTEECERCESALNLANAPEKALLEALDNGEAFMAQRDVAEAHAKELYAESLDAARRYKTEIDAAEARVAAWKSAVEGLTPNGSEFVDDPAACARFIREQRQSEMRAVASANRKRAALVKIIEDAEHGKDCDTRSCVCRGACFCKCDCWKRAALETAK